MNRPPLTRRVALAFAVTLLVLSGGLVVADPAAASLPESHTFDGWRNGTLGEPDFLIAADSAIRRDGPIAMRMNYSSPAAGTGRYAHVFQDVLVQPGKTYAFSAWVRGEDVSAQGAFYLPLTGDHQQRIELPAGTYDWQQLTWEYTIPASQSSFRMRILGRGPGTVWFDQLSMTASGSSQNLLANPSFDLFQPPPGALRFSDDTLIYETGNARVAVGAQDSEVSWTLRADTGQPVGNGTEPVIDGTARINLDDRGPGYYTLETVVASPQPVTRTASLAIVEPRSTAFDSSHPFGLSMHARRHTVSSVNEMLTPLGVGMVRENPAWSDIEKTPGVYDFSGHYDDQIQAAIARGERPLVITPLSNPLYDGNRTPASPEAIAAYAAMVRKLAEHYGDAVDYEIYNEFNHTGNHGSCGRTPLCYMKLLEPTAAAIRDAAPGARIVGGGIAGLDLVWLKGLFELGALDLIDTVSFHTYDVPQAPEGETEAEVAGLKALLDEYDHPDMPIWMTEHGWHTQVGGVSEQLQSAYTVRSATLIHAAGVERILYYTMTDSGLNPAEKEHNFGLVRSNLGVNSALAPKPAYVGFSVLNRVTAGRHLDSVDRVGAAYVATYGSATLGDARVIWAPEGGTLDLDLPGEVQVIGPMGREWRAGGDGQGLQLTVGQQPVYVVGNVAALSVATRRFLTVDAPAQLALGRDSSFPAEVDGSALAITGDVMLSAVASPGAVVAAGPSPVEASLQLSPFELAGTQPWRVSAETAQGLAALQIGEVAVQENPALALVPGVDPATRESVTVLRAQSLAGAPQSTVGDVSWQIGGRQGTVTGAPIDGGAEVEFELERVAAEPWLPEDYRVTADVDGKPRVLTGRTTFAPVTRRGDAPLAEAQWVTHARWVSLGAAAPADAADLGGTFHLEWDDDALIVVARVADDDHVPGPGPAQLWAGDSLQIAVSPGLPGSSTARRELGAALLASGPVVYAFTSPTGPVASAAAVIERNNDNHTTTYEITLPWSVLGVNPADGVFSFSAVLNDNDNGTRGGFLEWGSGIGGRKESALFLPVTLLPAATNSVPPVLSALSVDGAPLDGFHPTTEAYEIEALAGGPLPQISARTDEPGASVAVVQATSAPGEARVTVVGAGGERIYRVAISRVVGDEAAMSAEARLACDQGAAVLVVQVRNDAPRGASVRVAGVQGDQRRDDVAPGDTVDFRFPGAVGTGSVAVSSYVPFAPGHAASYVWQRLDFDLGACPA